MIPADLTARLRLLTEASFFSKEPKEVDAPHGAKGTSKDLPDFQPGQRIVALIGEARSENSFRALIDGREYTLTLPKNAARSGQTLELVVTHASPRAVIATPADAANAAASTSLSQTGRMISFLLTGQPPVPAATLAAGRPLLPAPPAEAAQLVPVLRQAVAESGMFYESQMTRWLSGAIPTDTLLRQPQSVLTRGQAAAIAGAAAGSSDGIEAAHQQTAPAAARPTNTPSPPAGGQGGSALGTMAADAEEVGAALQSSAAHRGPGQNNANPVPERLMPIVHQQLDALATNNYAWQATVWPGQQIELEIEEPEEREGDGSEELEGGWKTTLRLTLPRLGGIEARLHLTGAGLALRLSAVNDATARRLDGAGRDLARALEAADLPLTGLQVEVAAPAEPSP